MQEKIPELKENEIKLAFILPNFQGKKINTVLRLDTKVLF